MTLTKGFHASVETEFKKGHKQSNTGRTHFKKGSKGFTQHHTIETRKKISENRKGLLSGSQHWNWKGGITSFEYSQRRKFKQTMQKQVFERDNYTCQLCGIKGVDLQVDHIQSWAEYVEQRFNINNCRTLCAKCHYKITFGKPMPENIKGWGHNLLEGRVNL